MSEGFIAPITGYRRAFAFISVTYPEGSVCTCTHTEKGKVLTAKDTSGSWIFVVPYEGTWTVTASDGNSSVSHSVEVHEKSSVAQVELGYDLWIIKDGKDMGVGGFPASGYVTLDDGNTAFRVRQTKMSDATVTVASTEGSFDFSQYSSVLVRGWVKWRQNHSTYKFIARSGSSEVAGVYYAQGEGNAHTTPTELSIDISDISAMCDFAITWRSYWSGDNDYAELYIDQLCLIR